MALFTGSLNDVKRQWFQSKSAGGQASNDLGKDFCNKQNATTSFGYLEGLDKYLAGLGYTGSPRDRYRKALVKSLGGSFHSSTALSDLEMAFYSSSLNVFVVGP